MMLTIASLHATVDGKPILKCISLTLNRGEIHMMMGPNGPRGSKRALALAGRPGDRIAVTR